METYEQIAKESRIKVLELIYKAQTSHIGSNFSCADIMAVLFEKIDLDKDKFILSAGWKAAILYFHLWRKGRITEEELNSYCQEGSKFIGLAEPIIPEISFAGGSMQMGTAASVGFALSKKLKKEEGKVYVLESDGGTDGGLFWESMLLAAHHNLDNLVLIIDANGFSAMGIKNEILNVEPLKKKLEAFGWDVREVDGHNHGFIEGALLPSVFNKPLAVIAHTTKGKGVSFFENNNEWHYLHPTAEQYELALKELSQ